MLKQCVYPDITAEASAILNEEKYRIIIGVIGKSATTDCNKMYCFDIFQNYVSLVENEADCREGRIKFYFKPTDDILFVHFETTYDSYLAYKLINETEFDFFLSFNSILRTKFARMLLFATQVCHIIIFVEPSSHFDESYLPIFRSLRVIREKYVLKFLPKLLKNSNAGNFLGKEGRLCSPRFLFFYEKLDRIFENENEIFKYEIVCEDKIYKLLRNEFIITNNTSQSLFSIPRNKRFVYYNTNNQLRIDPIVDSANLLAKYIESDDDEELSNIKPYRGYAINYDMDVNTKREFPTSVKPERSFLNLIMEHVDEALQHGFDDSLARFRGKGHFVKPTIKSWFEAFKILHKIFVENPENENFEANDPDYKAYLENFHKIMDIDEQFFADSSIRGYDAALQNYKDLLPNFYSRSFHDSKVAQALEVFYKYARGPEAQRLEQKLRLDCDQIWTNGKQQCEHLSLRGNPCIKPALHDGNQHSSGISFISTCNCGKTQGRREDPYTIRQANFEFYQLLANNCSNCNKVEKIIFPVFQPSVNDFKAAELIQKNMSHLLSGENSNRTPLEHQHSEQASLQLSGSQKTQNSGSNLSLDDLDEQTNKDSSFRKVKKTNQNGSGEEDEEEDEIVIKVGEFDNLNMSKEKALRQVSTTEYLPSMLQLSSPQGLLPQFPSWALVCIGPSSIYSHNSGLPEHTQSGFLSGTNFLLPWDVKVRLEHSQSWAENYEKTRNRKKHLQNQGDGTFFTLKIFIGCEYECKNGHRFIMASHDSVLRVSSGNVVRDSGSKCVFSNMPIYFNCPCRQNNIGQLSRIHIVTPKAPVHIHITPRVKIPQKNGSLIFTTGLEEIKLTQSAYWILRLPYVFHGEDGPILPPKEISSQNALQFGYLMEGMYGIKEDSDSD